MRISALASLLAEKGREGSAAVLSEDKNLCLNITAKKREEKLKREVIAVRFRV